MSMYVMFTTFFFCCWQWLWF